MGRKWKSVKDMVKDLSDSDFYNKYINRDMHPIALQMLDSRYLRNYQDRRFYLSDYPEQEKLREEYFEKKKYKWFYDWYKAVFTKDLKQNNLIGWYIDYIDNISNTVSNIESVTVEYHPELFEEEKDYFFISKFLTRR